MQILKQKEIQQQMIVIVKAGVTDASMLTDLGRKCFEESHGMSASITEINSYLAEKYTDEVFRSELSDSKNNFQIIYYENEPVGYSKIIFNASHPNIEILNVTKLERLYLLKKYYNLKLGLALFQFNMELSKQNNQAGMWLYVWKENHRAVHFYKKAEFEIIGSYDFKLTETHSNPNYQMLLRF